MRLIRTGADPDEPRAFRVIHAITSVMSLMAGLGIVLLMLLSLADIASRKFVGPGLAGAYEVTEIGLAIVVFAGMASAEAHKTHIRTPLFTERLPPRAADIARLVGLAVVIVVLAIMTFLTARAGLESYSSGEYRFGLNQVPVWPAKVFIPIGLAALLLEFIIDAANLVRRLRRGGPYPDRSMVLQDVEIPGAGI